MIHKVLGARFHSPRTSLQATYFVVSSFYLNLGLACSCSQAHSYCKLFVMRRWFKMYSCFRMDHELGHRF